MKTIFIGPSGDGRTPTNGASVKNYHILHKLTPLINNLTIIDTENWKKKPKILLRLLSTIILNKKAKYILSLNTLSANKIIKILNTLAPNAYIIYWVIGGSFDKRISSKELSVSTYKNVQKIIVEGESMRQDLCECGLTNVDVLPNFKIIRNSFNKKETPKYPIRFVFLSRIMPQKGCNHIIRAISELNKEGYTDRFKVDFYGPIDESYRATFLNEVQSSPNMDYKGFLDLRNADNYRTLNAYDAMLFPTIWPGEGCPGIVIDAYIAGIPILASDWNLNKDYIKDNKTGLLFKADDSEALKNTILNCILNPNVLGDMYCNIPEVLKKFDIVNVLSKRNLTLLRIIE
jgi:glycosyltransferase